MSNNRSSLRQSLNIRAAPNKTRSSQSWTALQIRVSGTCRCLTRLPGLGKTFDDATGPLCPERRDGMFEAVGATMRHNPIQVMSRSLTVAIVPTGARLHAVPTAIMMGW